MNARALREDGVTLIELLATVVILGIVISAIGGALFLGLKTSDEAQARLEESHDAQLLSAYFAEDAASQTTLRRDVSTCGEAAAAGETPVAFFKWTESGTTKIASYFVSSVTVGGSPETQLIRRRCSAGAQTAQFAVVHNLAASAPAITCTPSAAACPATGSSTTATSVTITVAEAGGFSFSLTATRRAA